MHSKKFNLNIKEKNGKINIYLYIHFERGAFMNIAIITGASSGIGREFAIQLNKKEKFDEIWLIARRVQKMEALSNEISVKTKILPLDLTKSEDIEKFSLELEKEKPNIRYLVNSSGYGKFGSYDEVSLTDSSQMIDLNCKALVMLTLHSIKYMTKGSKIIASSHIIWK